MTEKIESDEVMPRGTVTPEEPPSYTLSVKFALWVVGISLAIAAAILVYSFACSVDSLQTWALSQLSLILGAALGFVWKSNS